VDYLASLTSYCYKRLIKAGYRSETVVAMPEFEVPELLKQRILRELELGVEFV